MKRAIQFGAGNIGRGFIGAVLSEAGYHVVFADVNMEVIDRINKDGAYTVHIMDVESRDHHHGRRAAHPALHRPGHRQGHRRAPRRRRRGAAERHRL